MQPAPTPTLPTEITLDPARLLGGLPCLGQAAASRTMVGVKELPQDPREDQRLQS